MTSNRRLAAAGPSRRGLIGLGSPCAAGHAGGAPEALSRRPVVVELYTSQGCSSCPPADALLGQLSARKDILALSLPITYWDMLGWKDTLASEANSRRQKAYARVLGRGGVYTPAMIVDGMGGGVGRPRAAAIPHKGAATEGAPGPAAASRRSRPRSARAWLTGRPFPSISRPRIRKS